MSFSPVLPFRGYPGWAFLSRTLEAQQSTYDKDEASTRLASYFQEKIGSVHSAEELVDDRRLLEVALTSFGLESDINNKAFVRQVLDSDTFDPQSLANRLSDKRYIEFAKAFGFGDFEVPNTQLSDFGPDITRAFLDKKFEVAIGERDPDIRLALGIERELSELAEQDISDTAKWFTMMGNAPMRRVFDTAFGMPPSFAAMDLDKQLSIFRDQAARDFGTTSMKQFEDPDHREKLIRNFLIRSDAQSYNPTASGGRTALTLLQNSHLYG